MRSHDGSAIFNPSIGILGKRVGLQAQRGTLENRIGEAAMNCQGTISQASEKARSANISASPVICLSLSTSLHPYPNRYLNNLF